MLKMNIIIRTDASINIGSGHIVRCLTLADELKQRSVNVSFICREEEGNLIELIEKKGYKAHRLPASIALEDDNKLIQKVLEKNPKLPDWLIIDHYNIDFSWETPLRKFVKKIMVIDDLANRRHYCELLLDQNLSVNKNRYHRLLPDHCIQLLGPKYALLRPQFRKAQKNLRERNGEVRCILIFLGGVDPSNEICKVLRGIQMLGRDDIAIDVVIGESNPNHYHKEVETLAFQMPNTTCHFHVENMAELMVGADLSLGGSGTTTWERCSMGLPSVVIVLAENQTDLAESLSRRGIIVNLGWYEKVTEYDIKKAVKSLINDSDKRKMMSLMGKKIVDGKGTERVVEKILRLSK